MKKLHILGLSILLLNCAVQKYSLSPTEKNESNDTYFDRGKEVISSQMPNSEIRLIGEIESGNITLLIGISNPTESRIEFNPMDIKVIGIDNYDFKGYMKVIQPEKYLRSIEREKTWNLLAEVLNNANASANQSKRDKYIIQTIGKDNLSKTENYYNEKYKMADENILKRHTIFGNEKIAGFVLVKIDTGVEKYAGFNGTFGLKKVKLEIPLGKDIHILNFVVKPSI